MAYRFKTSKKRSDLMKKIKSNNTKPEVAFRKALWACGLRYRKNDTRYPGKPDIVIPKFKVAVFIDGEFWHGYRWKAKKKKIKSNRGYWIPKIEKNIKRDKANNRKLRKEGWKVLRFWEKSIKKDLPKCVGKVKRTIKKK
ncbi:MAG: very short patch repair endonuclease [Candidatus Omnitrophica bacterium]|nr:very short patch repair endonuclease [Candidatus Omnitrophota bacterium]